MSTPPDAASRLERTLRARDRSRLRIAALLSVAVHVLLILAVFRVTHASQPRAVAARQPDEAPRPTVPLGLAEAPRSASVVWLGFVDPTPHEAEQATVEQAQLDVGAANAQNTSQTDDSTDREPAEPSPEDEALAIEAPELELEPFELSWSPDLATSPAPDLTVPTPFPFLRDVPIARSSGAPKPREASEPAQPDSGGGSSGAEQQNPTPNPSDRQASATSIDKPADYRPGRPLSAQGLEIRTVRPRFTQLTRVIRGGRNPVVEIAFNRHGKVRSAVIVRGGGGQDINGPVISAVYNWTAEGKALDDLPPAPKTGPDEHAVTLFIRIVLTR